jgi:hypothetical protein
MPSTIGRKAKRTRSAKSCTRGVPSTQPPRSSATGTSQRSLKHAPHSMLLRSTLIFSFLLFGCCRKPAEVIRTSAIVHTDRQVVTAGSLTELTLPDLCDSAGVVRRFALRDSAKTSVLSVANSGSGIVIRLRRDTIVERLIMRDTTIVERVVQVKEKKRKSRWPILFVGAIMGLLVSVAIFAKLK